MSRAMASPLRSIQNTDFLSTSRLYTPVLATQKGECCELLLNVKKSNEIRYTCMSHVQYGKQITDMKKFQKLRKSRNVWLQKSSFILDILLSSNHPMAWAFAFQHFF